MRGVLKSRGEGPRRRVHKEQVPHEEGKEGKVDARFDMQPIPASCVAVGGKHQLLHSACRLGTVVD